MDPIEQIRELYDRGWLTDEMLYRYDEIMARHEDGGDVLAMAEELYQDWLTEHGLPTWR